MLKLASKGHRVAIAGQVQNSTDQAPIPGARVEITQAPAAFDQWLALKRLQYGDRWGALLERCDRTLTAPDGLFYFTDLPPGRYTLVASVPMTGRWGQRPEPVPDSIHRSAPNSFQVTVAAAKPPLQTLEIAWLAPAQGKAKTSGRAAKIERSD